jgi:uncharacterized protein YehS (DUF1456 family)
MIFEMNTNDVLRRIRYIFDFEDAKMIELFGLGNLKVTRAQLSNWLRKDDDLKFKECGETQLAIFLNGLIVDRRGKKDGPTPKPEKRLTNNIIFTKLKIALNLKAEDVLDIFNLADFPMSKHELSSYLRRPTHRNYRDCKDQVLRTFLKGLQLKFRPIAPKE